MTRLLSLTTLFAAIVACTTPYTHLRGAPGTDYFRPEFACKKGALPKEQDALYLLMREKLRTAAFRSPVSEPPFMVIAGESTAALFEERIYRKGNIYLHRRKRYPWRPLSERDSRERPALSLQGTHAASRNARHPRRCSACSFVEGEQRHSLF